MDVISTHVRNSILRASTAHVDSTAARSKQIAVYLRLSSVSAHAGGSLSGVIELHVPLNISEVRIGCSDNSAAKSTTLIVPHAWIELTGIYKDEHQPGVFHHVRIPLTNTVIQNEPQAPAWKEQSIAERSISSQTDSEPTSPGVDCSSPRRRYAAVKRKSRIRSPHQQLGFDQLSVPNPIGVSETDAEGNTRYNMSSGKTLIPFKIPVDPRLANSYDYEGAAITYWISWKNSTIHDSISFHSRQVEIYQLEGQNDFNPESSMSSTSSKIAMGGPGRLEVVAWVESPAIGIIDGSEARVIMFVRNFTRKKTQGIKLEVFRSRDTFAEKLSPIREVKIAEKVFHGEDHRFEPGYSTHVTVAVKIPAGNYSSNGIPGYAINYIVKSSVMAPLSDPVYVISPIRIVRHQSFPDGCFRLPTTENTTVSTDSQTKVASQASEAVLASASNNYQSKIQLAQAKLESILQHDALYKERPKYIINRSNSGSEGNSTDSLTDSENDNTPKLAFVARICKPKYRLQRKESKPSRNAVKLTLDTSLSKYRSSTSSHETGTADLSDSRFSLLQNNDSLASPQTPVEYLDDHQVWVRTMSAPNLTLPPGISPDVKRLSNPMPTVTSDIEASLGDAFKRSAISRRTHVKAVSWRSGFEENRNQYCRSR